MSTKALVKQASGTAVYMQWLPHKHTCSRQDFADCLKGPPLSPAGLGRLPPPDTIRSIPLLSIGDLQPAIPPAASADKATKEEEPMLLSILSPQILGKLVTKIQAGAFIDMKA